MQLSMSMIPNQDYSFDRQTVTRAMDMGYTTETIRKAIQMFFGKEFNKPLQCLIDMKDIEEKIKQKMTEDERIQREAEIEDLRMRLKCKVCLENELEMVFLPCCHLCTCVDCETLLTKCPICREQKTGKNNSMIS
ncbi:E3 ubiquitin-protein ligase XIAP-like [Argopecten irradians]|uniref:E3 ubiquitin-protein ligase XIAP-like n=1 Tax=Argopecten irradians TaxID=31199 RepID=UPI003713DD81